MKKEFYLIIILFLGTAPGLAFGAGPAGKGRFPLNLSAVEVIRDYQGKKEKKEILLVDVRPKEEFARAAIPGSVNIPLHSLRTKTYLKNRPLVLLGEGALTGSLKKEASRLRELGFTVSVLEGGLHAWKKAGGLVEGDLFAQKEWNRISPAEFAHEKKLTDWVVLNLSPLKGGPKNDLTETAADLSLPVEEDKAVSLIRQTVYSRAKTASPYILVFNRDGQGYGAPELLMDKAGFSKVFFLEGGFKGFARFERDRKLMAKPRSERTISTSKCPTCGKKNKEQ